MGYDVTTLTLIGQAIHRDKSPTWELLNKFSERNGKIKHLFIMLAKMDHQRGMSILQPYGRIFILIKLVIENCAMCIIYIYAVL